MTDRQPRTREQRRVDTLAKLSAPAADVWVATATADAGGNASSYLVPLSLAWLDERVVLATEVDSVTARNIVSHGRARLGLGPTRDVVMIDALLFGHQQCQPLLDLLFFLRCCSRFRLIIGICVPGCFFFRLRLHFQGWLGGVVRIFVRQKRRRFDVHTCDLAKIDSEFCAWQVALWKVAHETRARFAVDITRFGWRLCRRSNLEISRASLNRRAAGGLDAVVALIRGKQTRSRTNLDLFQSA